MQGRVVATLWVALILWLVRVAAIYGGSWLGSWLGGTPPEYRLRIWQGMITQCSALTGIQVPLQTYLYCTALPTGSACR